MRLLTERNYFSSNSVFSGGVVYGFLVLTLFSGVLSLRQTKQCQSIDQYGKLVPGQCIQFLLCPRLLEFAKRPGKTLEDFRLLKTLTCGFHKDEPWICCPEKDIYHPPAREEEYVKLSLEFPNEDSMNTEYSKVGSQGSPDVSFAATKGRYSLIPRLEDCGEPRQFADIGDRIIGGSKANITEFPYMALLYRIDTVTDEEEYYCSGTIINQFYILTAAHCILTNSDSAHKLAYIQVGVTDVTERCHKSNQRECLNDRRYEVKDTVVHPKYVYGSRDRSHDIALLRTAKPIDLNEEFVRPVCLPLTREYGLSETFLRSEEDHDGQDGTYIGMGIVAGWGRESNFGPQSATSLKHTTLPILSKNECQERYGSQVKISEKHLCAGGEKGRDTCVGDSGGPLLLPFEPEINNEWERRFTGKMFQTGIISFGPALCGTSGKPSVYTKIKPYIDWILDSMYL